jgi:hypothetical protein
VTTGLSRIDRALRIAVSVVWFAVLLAFVFGAHAGPVSIDGSSLGFLLWLTFGSLLCYAAAIFLFKLVTLAAGHDAPSSLAVERQRAAASQ